MDFSDYMAYIESGKYESDYWKNELKEEKERKVCSMWKQVKFRVINPDLMDNDSNNIFGGIAEMIEDMLDGELVPIWIICGHCGCEFGPEDVEILEYYADWMDLTDIIVGY